MYPLVVTNHVKDREDNFSLYGKKMTSCIALEHPLVVTQHPSPGKALPSLPPGQVWAGKQGEGGHAVTIINSLESRDI